MLYPCGIIPCQRREVIHDPCPCRGLLASFFVSWNVSFPHAVGGEHRQEAQHKDTYPSALQNPVPKQSSKPFIMFAVLLSFANSAHSRFTMM